MADNDHNTRWPSPSVTSVPEYQLSGLPFCHTKTVNGTSSFTFPRVTRWITVSSTVAVKIFFAEDPDNAGDPHDNKFFIVPANTTTLRLELRCAKLYVKTDAEGSVSVAAGLTHIDKSRSIPEDMLDWTIV